MTQLNQEKLETLWLLHDENASTVQHFEHFKTNADVFERMAFWAEVQARASLRIEAALLEALGPDQ